MPGYLATARAALAVRRAAHIGLAGFTTAGIAVCLIWAALLTGGRTLTLHQAGALFVMAGVAGAVAGLLKAVLSSPRKVAAYIDWRLQAGGTIMAAQESGGRFVEYARGKLTPRAALVCATPFLPRWASLVLLPIALALLLAGSSTGNTKLLGFQVEFGAGGGGGEGGAPRDGRTHSGTRLVLFRARPSHSESTVETGLEGLLSSRTEGSASPVTARPQGGPDSTGDTSGEETGGGGTSETAEGAGVTPAGGDQDEIPASGGSLSPEWISIGRKYARTLRENR